MADVGALCRFVLVVALSALLAGCWVGESFYTVSESRPALPPGRYQAANVQGDTGEGPLDISIRPSGLTRIADNRDQEMAQFGFAPLPGSERDHVAWLVQRSDSQAQQTLYGLLRRLGEGDYLLFLPQCRATVAAARVGRAEVSGPDTGSQACTFADRAGLEAALRRLQIDPEHLAEGMVRLRRIPNG